MESSINSILDFASVGKCECEVYGERVRRYRVEMHRRKIESIESSRDAGIAIRLVHEGRVGHVSTSDLSPDGLSAAFQKALECASNSTPVDVDILAPYRKESIREGLYPKLPSAGGNQVKIAGVRTMEEACLSHDPRIVNTEGASYTESVGEVFVASTRGFFRTEERGFCSCSIQAIAKQGDEIRSGWFHAQGLDCGDLDFASTGREAAARAVGLVGSRRIETRRYPVVLDGSAVTSFLGLLKRALSGEMVVKGASVLAGRKGSQIAPEYVTVIDDPFLEAGCNNAAFDGEGAPTERRVVVESGSLRGYLHNAFSARKLGVPVAANAVRATFKDLPEPGPTNLFLLPGARSTAEMVDDLIPGIYVLDVMGMHTADHISGDFSVGISGYHVRSGGDRVPISEMMMSGNVLDLLAGIREVGKDSIFIGPYGSPAIRIDGMSISGT
ncbi:MAG: TldD/PmbA family protein [bacterium]|nr:MAG: TldD/PmbA family protein [bacterium]